MNEATKNETADAVAGQVQRVVMRDMLAEKHTGMRVSARGVLGRIARGDYFRELDFGCGEMLKHLEEMAARFYAGDVKAVDEFLQLYALDDERPDV